jgi:uncharacterized membrane protein
MVKQMAVIESRAASDARFASVRRTSWRFWSLVIFASAAACSSRVEGGAPSAASGASSTLSSSWCATDRVLSRKCRRCHQDPPLNGAPFPLLSYEDTQVVDGRGKPRFQKMADAVASAYMPPQFLSLTPPVEPLTDEERTILLDWCAAGARADEGAACDGGT